MEMINVAKLLRDCPEGMELDCTMYNKVALLSVSDKEDAVYPITVLREDGNPVLLTKYGQYTDKDFAKCIIFPKGKTTWEGFHRPFKDGDVVAFDTTNGVQVFIFKEYRDIKSDYSYCYMMLDSGRLYDKCNYYYINRFATEEEKAQLFKAIKENGYKWNLEEKILERLVKPIFKPGDKVRNKNNQNIVFTITSLEEDYYVCGAKAAFWFDDQDDYELVSNKFDITTLKPFDKVLVRDNNGDRWDITFYELYNNKNKSYPYRTLGGTVYKYCIPYKGNEHLVGLVKDCDTYYKTWTNEEE